MSSVELVIISILCFRDMNRSNLDQIGQMAVKCDLPPIVVPLLMLQLPAFETVTDGAL